MTRKISAWLNANGGNDIYAEMKSMTTPPMKKLIKKQKKPCSIILIGAGMK